MSEITVCLIYGILTCTLFHTYLVQGWHWSKRVVTPGGDLSIAHRTDWNLDPSNDGIRARNFLVWRFCVRADLYHNETIKKVPPPFFCLETWTVKLFNENDVHVYWESHDHYILVTIKDLFFWQRVVYLYIVISYMCSLILKRMKVR